MMIDMLRFLLKAMAGFFGTMLLLRFFLVGVRASFQHPFTQFVMKLTNWVVLPLRKKLPPIQGQDTASFVLAFLTFVLANGVLLSLAILPFPIASPEGAVATLLIGALDVVRHILYLFTGALLLQAVLSWVNPYAPIAPLVQRLTAPILEPVQRIIPNLGGIDLSPMVVLLLIELLQSIVLRSVEQSIFTLLLKF